MKKLQRGWTRSFEVKWPDGSVVKVADAKNLGDAIDQAKATASRSDSPFRVAMIDVRSESSGRPKGKQR